MNKKFKNFCDKKLKKRDFYSEMSLKYCQTPITVFLGPNGTGKSMSLRNIEYECNKQNIKHIEYSTRKNDIVANNVNYDPYKLSCAFHSEGERMCDSFDDWASHFLLRELLTNEKDLVICIDEGDSGLSIDRIKDSFTQLLEISRLEKEKHPNRDVRFIFTCNSYELYEVLQSEYSTFYWIPTKEKINPRNYNEFKKRYIEYSEYMNRY